MGDRHQQIVDGVTTTYTLDLNAGLTQVLADGTNTYLYGNGRISQSQITNPQSPEYFLGDALGSVRQLADPAGAVTLTQSYSPYGETVSSVGDGYSVYQYTGEIRDSYIKLIYLRSRYYAPETGRFLTKDSWQGDYNRPLSLNRWNYVEGNPVNKIDPSGHSPVSSTVHSAISTRPSAQSQIYLALAQTGSQEALNSVFGCSESQYSNGIIEKYCGQMDNTADYLNCGAMLTQDVATLIDLAGVGIEASLVAVGCFVGGPAGCAEGLGLALAIWKGTGDIWESIASNASLAFTIAADLTDDGKLGEMTETSVILAVLGTIISEPTADLFVDGYGSGYNHEILNDIRSVFNGEPLIKP